MPSGSAGWTLRAGSECGAQGGQWGESCCAELTLNVPLPLGGRSTANPPGESLTLMQNPHLETGVAEVGMGGGSDLTAQGR